MKFGRSATEAAQEPSRGGGGGDFIKYLKDGDNTFRILQEPEEWLYWWEHFSPAGFSFPCPRAADEPVEVCPGCRSDNEKMKKVDRKIGFNVLHSFNGTEYVDAFKIGPTVEGKLKNRYERLGTLTDRDYTVTRYKTSGDRWDFDVDGAPPSKVDLRKEEWKDIEAMLAAAYDEAWGDGPQAQANQIASRTASEEQRVASKVKRAVIERQEPAPDPEEPPFEERVYKEETLRAMDRDDLLTMIVNELGVTPDEGLDTTDQVVDWLMANQS